MNEVQTTGTLPLEEDEPNNEIVHISDMGQFITLMQDWHTDQVATVQHFLEVPSGIEVQIEGEPNFLLEGDILKGFKLGIQMALSYLGELPFYAQGSEDATKH